MGITSLFGAARQAPHRFLKHSNKAFAAGHAFSTSAGDISASRENDKLPFAYRFGPQAAVAFSSAFITVSFGTSSSCGHFGIACARKCRPKKDFNVSRSARNQVSITCTIRNAWPSFAPSGLSQLSPGRADKCSQTDLPFCTAVSLSTRRSGNPSGAGFLNAVTKASYVLLRPPQGIIRGSLPFKSVLAKNVLKDLRQRVRAPYEFWAAPSTYIVATTDCLQSGPCSRACPGSISPATPSIYRRSTA